LLELAIQVDSNGHAIARVPKLSHNCINIKNSIAHFTKNEGLELVVAHSTHAINSFLTFGLIFQTGVESLTSSKISKWPFLGVVFRKQKTSFI
jgi:hypothetical protein